MLGVNFVSVSLSPLPIVNAQHVLRGSLFVIMHVCVDAPAGIFHRNPVSSRPRADKMMAVAVQVRVRMMLIKHARK